MTSPDGPRKADSVQFRTDVVTKSDGRYLIYYSWPDDALPAGGPGSGAAAPARPADAPDQTPWSPETGPPDV
ncbi:hypothetical protein BH24CHL7_BH24CHL7_13310 [soil metagenome]|jgi:hypothetical protein